MDESRCFFSFQKGDEIKSLTHIAVRAGYFSPNFLCILSGNHLVALALLVVGGPWGASKTCMNVMVYHKKSIAMQCRHLMKDLPDLVT